MSPTDRKPTTGREKQYASKGNRPDGKGNAKEGGKPGGRFEKPADRLFGKPAGKTFGKPGGKPFGKPADANGNTRNGAEGEKTGERFERPADRSFGKPVGKTFGKPAGKPGGFGTKFEGGRGRPMGAGGRPAIQRMSPMSRDAAPQERTGLSVGARRAALEVLRDVHENGAYAQLSLNEKLNGNALNPADKRLATNIVYGTLENQIRIDYALDRFMERPVQEIAQRDILRMSAYQILFLDRVPDSAAVNEGVNLAKGMGMESSAGFFNAVLRNLSRGKEELPWPKKEENLREYLHIMGSMPHWIVDRLISAYGEEEAEKIVMYRETEHPVVVRSNLMKNSDGELETLLSKKGWEFRRGLAPHAYLVTGAESIGLDIDYREGAFSIQGQSSMLAVEAVEAKPGMKILDACAAPGGKSAYLCEKMQGTGRVFAWELHEKRAMLLESMKRRLNLENLRISVRDASEPKPDMERTLDAVLLDAPCSGLGVMVQKPDLKHRLKEEDVALIVEQQRKLLNAVSAYVKPGGLLVYSTCSILPEENKAQVEAFLANHPEYTVEELPKVFPESLREQQSPLGLQLLGYRDDVEGFYIVRLRRTGA